MLTIYTDPFWENVKDKKKARIENGEDIGQVAETVPLKHRQTI